MLKWQRALSTTSISCSSLSLSLRWSSFTYRRKKRSRSLKGSRTSKSALCLLSSSSLWFALSSKQQAMHALCSSFLNNCPTLPLQTKYYLARRPFGMWTAWSLALCKISSVHSAYSTSSISKFSGLISKLRKRSLASPASMNIFRVTMEAKMTSSTWSSQTISHIFQFIVGRKLKPKNKITKSQMSAQVEGLAKAPNWIYTKALYRMRRVFFRELFIMKSIINTNLAKRRIKTTHSQIHILWAKSTPTLPSKLTFTLLSDEQSFD